MGKQTDAIKLIKEAFVKHPQIEFIDTDRHYTNPDRIKVSLGVKRNEELCLSVEPTLEEEIYQVYSGARQIEKLVEQRFTREDFFEEES